MSAKYELKLDSAGKFMFNLKAANGEVILTSQAYTAKASALEGIASVQKNGVSEAHFEVKHSTKNEPYFVLKATNGEVIGRSEMYSSEAAMKNGIASVEKNCPSAKIDDHTAA